jgi:hypothetical protein
MEGVHTSESLITTYQSVDWTCWYSGNALDSYSGCVRFESRLTPILPVLSCFLLSPSRRCRDSRSRSRPFSSKSFPIHLSSYQISMLNSIVKEAAKTKCTVSSHARTQEHRRTRLPRHTMLISVVSFHTVTQCIGQDTPLSSLARGIRLPQSWQDWCCAPYSHTVAPTLCCCYSIASELAGSVLCSLQPYSSAHPLLL